MDIEVFMCRQDNYGVLLHDPATGITATIDAPDEAAIEAALTRRGWRLDLILLTHRHYDHIEAAAPLRARHGARIIAPALARDEVPDADRYVDEGDVVELGVSRAQVWFTPGHCKDHICYYFADEKMIFVGDVLFVMGCGRVLDSTMTLLHNSVMRLATLPDDTKVFCGHEYTLANARFCAHIEPDNAAIAARLEAMTRLRAEGGFSVPTTIGAEKATNVFLRAADPAVFAARREAKNTYQG